MQKAFVDKFFDNIPVYVINLDDSNVRRDNIKTQFDGYDNLHFVEAIDGRNAEKFKKEYNVTYVTTINYTTAVIAVICSHAKAIKQAFDNGNEMACIFEDDVKLDLLDKCTFSLRDIIKINNEWDAIQLYYSNNLEKNHRDYEKNGIALLKRTSSYFGTCYIINRNGMRKMLKNVFDTDGAKNFVINIKINNPEDVVLAHINTYIINRPCVYYLGCDTITFPLYIADKKNLRTDAITAQNNAAKIIKSFYKL